MTISKLSLAAVFAVALGLVSAGGCSGGGGGVEVADPSKTPDPVGGGVPAGFKPKEVVIE